ncbi:hypothetical protein BLNAU_5232 [Blattamonas nauphoetae]|uniref:Uncharacterized protein n=1 Tax=Blattamonas nauphoetae TaxID=2049346 RepID=A0ABQ9Y7K1_9EUKA|nr:hypothetical protein BLNAU_5232 [Blattamonas nauphoetae]
MRILTNQQLARRHCVGVFLESSRASFQRKTYSFTKQLKSDSTLKLNCGGRQKVSQNSSKQIHHWSSASFDGKLALTSSTFVFPLPTTKSSSLIVVGNSEPLQSPIAEYKCIRAVSSTLACPHHGRSDGHANSSNTEGEDGEAAKHSPTLSNITSH